MTLLWALGRLGVMAGRVKCVVLLLCVMCSLSAAFNGRSLSGVGVRATALNIGTGGSTWRGGMAIAAKAFESDYDNYDDFLNLDKPIEGDVKKAELTKQEVSILPPMIRSDGGEIVLDEEGNNVNMPPRKFRGLKEESGLVSAQRKWPNWDKFMEEHLGDLDEDLVEDDSWMWDARNAVEAKRGFAIWSKRSPKEIEKEVQKSVAAKTIGVPRGVATILRAVHMERSHSMKLIRKENELAAIEFRKWMIERRQKQKKDPLPLAKIEVSKSWLTMHPTGNMISASLAGGGKGGAGATPALPPLAQAGQDVNERLAPFSSNTGGPPSADFVSLKGKVIMDECAVTLRGTSFSGSGGLGGKSDKESKAANNVLVTSSMKLWDKEEEDMPAPRPTAADLAAKRASGSMVESFAVDEEEMFLASQASDNFFVVI